MKKIAFIALLSVSVLTIAGCGRTRTQKGKLPSGGTEIDIYSEEGKSKLAEIETGMAEKLSSNLLSSFGVNLSSEDVNYGAELNNFNVSNFFSAPASASIKMKGIGADLAVKVAKNSKGNVDASATLDNVKGKYEIKAYFPEMRENSGDAHGAVNIDSSLDISGAKAAAYYQGEYVYVDASNLDNVVAKAETFVNEVIAGLNQSFVAPYIASALSSYLDESGNMPLSAYWDSLFGGATNKKIKFYVGETQWFSEDDQASLVSYLKELDVVSLIDAANEIGINTSMVIYKEGTYGFQLSLDKEGLMGMINTILGENIAAEAASILSVISDSITKFDVSAAFYFEDYMLTSASLGTDIAISIPDLGVFVPEESRGSVALTGSVSASISGSIFADIAYQNTTVSFPDLSGYTLMEISKESSPEDLLED